MTGTAPSPQSRPRAQGFGAVEAALTDPDFEPSPRAGVRPAEPVISEVGFRRLWQFSLIQ